MSERFAEEIAANLERAAQSLEARTTILPPHVLTTLLFTQRRLCSSTKASNSASTAA